MAGQDKFTASIEEALKLARHSDGARNILAMLFPKVERAIKTYVPSDQSESAERKRRLRVSEKEFSPIYFGLDPRRASWGVSELESLLSSAPAEFFAEARRRIEAASEADRSRLRRHFLDALDGVFGETRPFTQEWLNTIIDESPYFLLAQDEVAPVLFSVRNDDRLQSILHSAFRQLTVETRAALLINAIPTAADVSLLCGFVRGLIGDQNPDGSQEKSRESSLEDQAATVRDCLVERVRLIQKEGQFWMQASPSTILWFWWGASIDGEEARQFSYQAMQEPEGLRGLLRVTPSEVKSSSGNYERVANYWARLVDLEELTAKAEQLAESAIDEDAQLAKRFLGARERGRQSSF